jgi:hypothetical protein
MARVMLISRVTFNNQQEEEKNIEVLNKVRTYLENNNFEVIDLRTLLMEANERISSFRYGPKMLVSKNAWISFCCMNFVLSNLAYCNNIFVCDNCEDCTIAIQIVSMAQAMGLSMVYLNEKKILTEEKFSEMVLPYIEYEKNNTDNEDHEGYEEEIEYKKETPAPNRNDMDMEDWFERGWGR